MKPIVIIGAGLAGYTTARELRKLDKTVPLIIVTADDGSFYSKPILSNAFAQGKAAEQLVTRTVTQMAQELGANILARTHASHIDTAGKTIATSAGIFEYDKLVIAVGAQPIRLPIAGDAAGEVLSVNHVDDYAAFRARVAQSDQGSRAHVTILGAGLIGCEFADDLASAGHRVTLVDPNPAPLAALIAPALSLGLQTALTDKGVTLQLQTTATSIDRRGGNTLQVTLANETVIEADVVLSAIGLRPDLNLAQASKLSTGRGIVIDATGQTSAADVYALGDCAEYTYETDGTTRTLPYIAPLMAAARAIARTLTGQPAKIDLKPTPVIVKTPSYPLAMVPPPLHAVASGYWEVEHDEVRTVCRFYDDAGVMCGFGVAPQEANIRAALMAALGTSIAKPLDAAA